MIPLSTRSNGRRLVWICGAGAIAALATAAVSWKDIVVHYHLERLRQDPGSLPSFLEEPDGTVKKLAARAFAREPQGREVVVSLFIVCFARARDEPARMITSLMPPMDLGEVDRAVLGFHEWGEIPGRSMFWGELRWRDAAENGWFEIPNRKVQVTCEGRIGFMDATRVVALAELLVECRGASLDLPHYPGLTVEVLTLESALDRVKSWTVPLMGSPVSAVAAGSSKPLQSSALLISRIIP